VTTTGQRRSAALRPNTIGLWVLFLCDAGLLVASGLIHLHLWDIAYRHVKTLDVLFLVQVVACLLLAVVLLVTRHLLAVAAAWLLMAGTIVGFILARTVGIFGFKLTFSTGLANTVLIVEAAALIMLTITGMVKVRSSRSRA
jgi:hypothetical protein